MARFHRSALPFVGLALVSLPLAALAIPRTSLGSTEPPPPPVITELGKTLSRAGLGAEALCAAGVSDSEVATVCADAEAAINAEPQTLEQLDQAYVTAKQDYDELRRKVRSGLASSQEVSECQSARTAYETAEADREAFLDVVFNGGVESLTSAEQSTLSKVRDNRSWRLATQYLVVDRTEPDWVALMDALAAKTIAENDEEAVPPQSQSLLSEEDSDPAVSAAKVNLDTYMAGVQTAWNTAVSD